MDFSHFQQLRSPPTLDEWNPQGDDYDSNFNSYDRGPGKGLPKREQSSNQKSVQLYVQGIPNEMTEDGLRNLFMKAGTVRKVLKMKSKKTGALDTYGFITMSNVREAEEAIRRYNNFRINQFMLKVRIALSLEEMQQRELKKQEDENFYQSLKTYQGKTWSATSGTDSWKESSKENEGSFRPHKMVTNGYGLSSSESPQSSPKYGAGRGGVLKGYQDSAKVGPSGDGQKFQCAGSMSSLYNTPLLGDSFRGEENPRLIYQRSPDRSYSVEGLKITVGQSDNLNESRLVMPTEQTMILRHHSSDQHHTGFGQGGSLMQRGRGLGQNQFAPVLGRGRKPVMGRGHNHYHHHHHVGRGRGFQNYYQMPTACCNSGLHGPSHQSYTVQPGLINMPSYVNPSLYMQNPYLLQTVPVTPQILMQSTAPTNMEDNRPVPEKSAKTVKIEPRECTCCKKMGTFQCKRCKIPYCCTDCQKQDWPRHKTYCNKIKELQSTDEFKDFDVTFGEDLVGKMKTLIEKRTGDDVVVDKSALENTCIVQQQQNRKSGKQTGKPSTGDQSGKVKESREAQDIQQSSKVADNKRKGISKSCGKVNIVMDDQISRTSQNRSGHKNKVASNCSEEYNRGKERNDRHGNQNKTGGAERKNNIPVPKNSSRNSQKDDRTVANEQDWENVVVEEKCGDASMDVAATKPTQPKPLSGKHPGSYPHPGTDKSQLSSSGPVLVSELSSVLSEVKVGEELEVIMTAHVSPVNFTVQILQLERIQMFSAFSDKLNELYDEEKEPYRPGKVGELVVAKYSFDQKWYRAEVTKFSPSTVSLTFIDFGNEEDAVYSQIRKAKPMCRKVASQSLKCCLMGMESQTITKEDIEEFGRRLKQIADPVQGRILFTIKAISKGYAVVDTVDVESNRSLAAVMKERFSSEKTKTPVSFADTSSSQVVDIKIFELPGDGSSILGQMVDITGLDSFHIQPQDETSKSLLESLMTQIQQYCGSMTTPYIPVIGELVCALFSDDNRWYRARVNKKVEHDIYSVCFVDYGNHANVNVPSIRVLEKRFAAVPLIGIPCRLAGLKDKGNQDFLREFVTMMINTVVNVKAVGFRDDFYDVEISLLDGTSVNEKVGCARSTAIKGEPRKSETGTATAAASERIMAAEVQSQQLPVDHLVHVELIELESLDCFYLKRTDIYVAAKHQELESEIGTYCVSNMTVHTPIVGEVVAAKFTNNKWYRAKVLQVKPAVCSVIFIDYGNQDDVEKCNIRKLEKEFTILPFVAIKCKLSGIQASTDDGKLLIFAENVIGQNVKGQAVRVDNGVTEVKLFSVDGSCINDKVALTEQKETGAGLSKTNEPLNTVSKTETVHMAEDVRPVELPSDGSKVEVEVVEIFDLEYFFVKTADDINKVKLQSQQIEMNIYYKEDGTAHMPVIGELVAAPFEGVWYRGKVVEGDGNIFNILYVDFGNVSAVLKDQIRKLKTKFTDLPLMAIPCRLQGLNQPVTQDMLLAFAGAVVEKRVLLESHGFIDGVMEVVLFSDDGTCINRKIVLPAKSTLASVRTSLTTEAVQRSPVTISLVPQEETKSAVMASDVQPYILTVDGTGVEVEVLVVHSLNSFYVQVTKESQQRKLKNLMADMAMFCSSSAKSYEPQVGEMVVAQYYEDQMWYRARVERVQDGVYDVFYVDYGNTEQVRASSLRKMEPMYGTLPLMAVHCKLWSSTCADDVSDLRIAKFAQEVLMKKVQMKAVGHVDGKYEVVIYLSDGTDIQSILGLEVEEKVVIVTETPVTKMVASGGGVARHMASQMKKVDIPEDGSFVDAVVFEMKGLDSFYIQKRSEEAKMLLEQMEEYCSKQTSRYAPVIGELVCARFSQDNSWYRAKVDELIEEGVYKVLFVDYGNSDIVSEEMMRKCDDLIFSVPQQGIHCKLSGIKAIHMDEKLQVFISSLVNVLVKVRVLKCISGVYEVEMYTGDGSACINNELKNLSKPPAEEVLAEENIDVIVALATSTSASASAASQDIIPGTNTERQIVLAKDFPCVKPVGSEFGIVITSVVDPGHFYCQLADEKVVSAFGEMMDKLTLHCQSEPALLDVVYTEGELCSAKFPADGKWYRACIKQLNPNGTVQVHYVDFGNEEVISLDALSALTEEFQTLPSLALRCSLIGIHPIDGIWKPEAVEVMKSLQERVLPVKLVEVFDDTCHLNVMHTREGGETVSLSQILIEAGLAQEAPVRKPSPTPAESAGTGGREQSLPNTDISTPDEDVKEKEELLLQEIEALKAKYEALKMKGNY